MHAGSAFSRVLAYITAAALGTLLLPLCRHSQRVVDVLNACFFHHWKRHISFRVVHEAGIDPQRQYVAACFPHGVFPLAAQMHATVWPAVHARSLVLLAASVLFYCPLWRHYMSVGAPPLQASTPSSQLRVALRCPSRRRPSTLTPTPRWPLLPAAAVPSEAEPIDHVARAATVTSAPRGGNAIELGSSVVVCW